MSDQNLSQRGMVSLMYNYNTTSCWPSLSSTLDHFVTPVQKLALAMLEMGIAAQKNAAKGKDDVKAQQKVVSNRSLYVLCRQNLFCYSDGKCRL